MTRYGARTGADTRRRWRRPALILAILGAYPAFVLVATYIQFFRADLPGGRHGPADAYRHSLASAIVAYTASPRCVNWVTTLMERGGRGNASRAMDARNNAIGARIGSRARSWADLQRGIRDAVQAGGVDAADPNQITWLPPHRWQNRLY